MHPVAAVYKLVLAPGQLLAGRAPARQGRGRRARPHWTRATLPVHRPPRHRQRAALDRSRWARGLSPAESLKRRHQRDRLRAAGLPRATRRARAQTARARPHLPRSARARGHTRSNPCSLTLGASALCRAFQHAHRVPRSAWSRHSTDLTAAANLPMMTFEAAHRCAPPLGFRVREFVVPRAWLFPLNSR